MPAVTFARPGSGRRFGQGWWREASGSVADVGVLIPIAVALIVVNGLSVTAVLLPAGLAYLLVARVYRVPVAVQPLKAFGALAIAMGAGADLIAAGSLLMGALFLLLGFTGLVDRLASHFPVAVIRGVQLAVGLTFARIAWGLIADTPAAFGGQAPLWGSAAGAVVAALIMLRWRSASALVLVAIGLGVAVAVTWQGFPVEVGPTPIAPPNLDAALLGTALVALVLPQVPLTFGNSCVAPADAARRYFGPDAGRVTPGRLARSLGATNLAVAAVAGMPLCHGAGGMSAHYAFGARTWRAPAIVGTALVVAAVALADPLGRALPAFPVAILSALLAVAAVTHVQLLRDLRGWFGWSVAIGVGLLGAAGQLLLAVVAGLALWNIHAWWRARRPRPAAAGAAGAADSAVDERAAPVSLEG